MELYLSNSYELIIEADQLKAIQNDCIILDCRHDLFDHKAGLVAFEQGHIKGAHFCNMETDTAGHHTGTNGRHPLPTRQAWRDRLAAFGLKSDQQLIAYDAHGGQFAVRVWWMARWIGHTNVAVLNGGLPAWLAASGAIEARVNKGSAIIATLAEPTNNLSTLIIKASTSHYVDADQLALGLKSQSSLLIDARATARYAGIAEPIDPVAGHIPGAINHFYQNNLGADGRFKAPVQLREQFKSVIGTTPPSQVVHQCGSGVTACHNILAMELAGLHGSCLYPGSWSEWCSDPKRAIRTGNLP